MSFIPCIFVEERWWADIPGRGIYSLKNTCTVNLFSAYCNVFLIVATLVFACVGIVALILQFIKHDDLDTPSKASRITNTLCFSPIASAVFFILLSIIRLTSTDPIGTPTGSATLGSHGHYTYLPGWGFYIECALILAVCIMSFLVATGKVKNIRKKPENTADELQKYKQLLDSGVITEEEYNAKKKDLLGL